MQEIVRTSHQMQTEISAYSSTLKIVVDRLCHEQKSELIDELKQANRINPVETEQV